MPSFLSRYSMIERWSSAPAIKWHQVALIVVFSLLLVFVALASALSPSPLLAVGLVAALGIAFIAMLRPSFALILVMVGAGLPSLLVPLPGHTMRPIEAALVLCMLVIVIRRIGMRLRLPHLLALLFAGITVVSFIHVPEISSDLNAYAADKRAFTILLTLLAFFCGAFLRNFVKDASSFLVTTLLVNIPLYLVGLGQALGIHIFAFLEVSGAQDPTQNEGRLWGPTNGAAAFGLYLINLFAVAVACWVLGIRRRDRAVGAIMTIATALEIMGSGTRSAAIAAALVAIVALVITRRFKLLVGMLLLTGTTVIAFLDQILPKFTHEAASTTNRVFLWQEALKLISSHPWIGIGLAQFHVYYAKLIVSQGTRLNDHGTSVHNQYLELAMESGVLALIVHLLLMVSIIFFCWRAYRLVQRNQQLLLLAAILAVLANMVTGFVDVPLDTAEVAVFLFMLAGLALGYSEYAHWGKSAKNYDGRLSFIQEMPAARLTTLDSIWYKPAARRSDPLSIPTPAALPDASDAVSAIESDAAPNLEKTSQTIVFRLISWGITIPIIFPVTALLTRYLGPTQYGEYSFTFPFFAIFALLSGTGMDPFIVRQLSRSKRTDWSRILSYAAGSRLLSTGLSTIAAIVVALVLPGGAEQRSLLLLGSVSLLFSFSFNGLRAVYCYGFIAEQRANLLFILETINRILTAGLVLLVVVLHVSLVWAYCLLIYSDIPFFIVQMHYARKRYGMRIRFSLASIKEQLLGSISLTGYDALALINSQIDVTLLLILAGPLSVGIYALAMRLTDPLLTISNTYVAGLYPLFCTKFEEGREQFSILYQESARILALGIIPFAIFVSVEAHTVVTLFGGERFAAAVIPMQLLMWSIPVSFLHVLAIRACTSANLERMSPYLTLGTAGVNVVLNLLLIPHWQFIGAGVATLASESVGLCLYSLLLVHQVYMLKTVAVIARVVLGNLPMLAFLLWQQHASLLLTIPIALLLVIVGCVATRVLTLKDIFMLQRFLLTKGNKLPKGNSKSIKKDISEQTTLILPRIQV